MPNEERGVEDTPRTKILISIPTDGYIHNTVAGVMFNILLNNKKYDITTMVSAIRGISWHRNWVVKEFLKTDCDYLIMIDDDNTPPDNMLDLIELDKDIISLPTPVNLGKIGQPNLAWNIFYRQENRWLPEPNKGIGLEEVEAVGSGCIIIARRVLEELDHPFTTVKDNDDQQLVGTDLAFCEKATESEFKIYTHWDYVCRHYKEINLLELL